MIGNPEIRFQANESVQRSISNSIRYAVDKQEKSEYHGQLGEMENRLNFKTIPLNAQSNKLETSRTKWPNRRRITSR